MSYRDPLEFDLTLSAHAHDLGCQTVANMIKPKGPRLSVRLDAADMQAKIDAQLAANLCGGLRPAADPVVDAATLLTEACRLAACAAPVATRDDAEDEWRDLIGRFDSRNTPFSDGIRFGFRVMAADMIINTVIP